MKKIVITALATVAVVLWGVIGYNELIDYLQYREALRLMDALIAL